MALSAYGGVIVGSSTTVQIGALASAGDLLSAGYVGTTASVTFSDNNNNKYSTPIVVGPDSFGNYISMSWAKNKIGASQPTITCTATGYIGVLGIAGFTYGPVVIPADSSSVVIPNGTALVTPGFTASKNSEISIGWTEANGETETINSSDYSLGVTAINHSSVVYAISTDGYSKGTSLVFNETLGASQAAAAIIQGFYDGIAPSSGNQMLTLGA